MMYRNIIACHYMDTLSEVNSLIELAGFESGTDVFKSIGAATGGNLLPEPVLRHRPQVCGLLPCGTGATDVARAAACAFLLPEIPEQEMRAAFVLLRDIFQHGFDTLMISILQLSIFARRKGDVTGSETVVMEIDDARMVGWDVLDDMLQGERIQ